jgi:hypothetical protein
MAAVPDPLAVEGVAVVDPVARTVSVRPAESRGYGAHLWHRGHQELVKAEVAGGYWGGADCVGDETRSVGRLPVANRQVMGRCGSASRLGIVVLRSWSARLVCGRLLWLIVRRRGFWVFGYFTAGARSAGRHTSPLPAAGTLWPG